MASIRLLLDENVRTLLADVLGRRGYDVVATSRVGLSGQKDPDVLKWAVQEGRAFLTHNTSDFIPLAREYATNRWDHWGIVVSPDLPFRELLARILRLMSRKTAQELKNSVEWLQNYRQ